MTKSGSWERPGASTAGYNDRDSPGEASRDLALPDALNYLQAQLALAFTTEDLKEGVMAFREKRDPRWHGQ